MSDQGFPKIRNIVGGKEVDPAGGDWIETFDPYLSRPWALIPRYGPESIYEFLQTKSVWIALPTRSPIHSSCGESETVSGGRSVRLAGATALPVR